MTAETQTPKKILLQRQHSVPTGVRIAVKNPKRKVHKVENGAVEGKEVAPPPAQDHHHLIHQGLLQALTDQSDEGGGEGEDPTPQVVSPRDPVGQVEVCGDNCELIEKNDVKLKLKSKRVKKQEITSPWSKGRYRQLWMIRHTRMKKWI